MGTLGKAIYTVGFWIRETGQAIDRLGCRLQGRYYFQEQLSRHRTLMNLYDKAPVVNKDVFVAPNASIIGDVHVGRASSICCCIGDVNNIKIGSGTNIQDNSLVHVAKSNLVGKVSPNIIRNNVTVGHSAVLHGCTVKDEAFVGMGATLLDGVLVEKNAMVAAGALVRQNTSIPCRESIFLFVIIAMLRAFSTRRSGYDRLVDESSTGLSEVKLNRSATLPAKVFGSRKKLAPEGNLPPASELKQEKKFTKIQQSSEEKQAQKVSKIHPIFSIFERWRRKKVTAKPEFARYMEYVKEGGLWDVNSDNQICL